LGLLLEILLLVHELVWLLLGRQLFRLVGLLVLEGLRPVLLVAVTSVGPGIDGSRHPRPGHGVRGREGGIRRAELLVHYRAAIRLIPLDLCCGGILLGWPGGRRWSGLRLGGGENLGSLLLLRGLLLLMGLLLLKGQQLLGGLLL
jgi:hypothetical protein